MDEATRFAVAKIFRKDGGGHVKAADIQAAFHELWEPCFGVPELLPCDPDGACRSKDLDQHFQSLGIEMDSAPANAHWKVSTVERQWVKELMSKYAAEQPGWPHEAIRTGHQHVESEGAFARLLTFPVDDGEGAGL